jgi:hypothetical protein
LWPSFVSEGSAAILAGCWFYYPFLFSRLQNCLDCFQRYFSLVFYQLVVHVAFFLGEFPRLGLKISLMHLLTVQDASILLLSLVPLNLLFSINSLALLGLPLNHRLILLITQLFISYLLLIEVNFSFTMMPFMILALKLESYGEF